MKMTHDTDVFDPRNDLWQGEEYVPCRGCGEILRLGHDNVIIGSEAMLPKNPIIEHLYCCIACMVVNNA